MPDSVSAQLGRRAAIELCGKPVAHGVYASERLNFGEVGKIAQGQSWSPTGLVRCDRPGVRPVKTGVFSRRQTCRGKSQAPRSLDSRVAGNQNPEAYRQGLSWRDPRVAGP